MRGMGYHVTLTLNASTARKNFILAGDGNGVEGWTSARATSTTFITT